MVVVLPDLGRLLGWRRRLCPPSPHTRRLNVPLMYVDERELIEAAPSPGPTERKRSLTVLDRVAARRSVLRFCAAYRGAVALYLDKLHSVDLAP